MGETVSFKALKTGHGEDEVRRFQVDKDVSSSFTYLHQKIATVFPDVARKLFQVTWTDRDGDTVTLGNDEDLMIALTEMEGPLYKISVTVRGDGLAAGPPEEEPQGDLHDGVTCDGCQGEVRGFRYKCVVCPDFDLCSRCEGAGAHPEHTMMRTTKQIPNWMQQFFRKSKRMHERAEKNREAEEEVRAEAGWCRWNPRGRGGPFRGGPCRGGPFRGGPFRGRGGAHPPPPPFFGAHGNPFEDLVHTFGGWMGNGSNQNFPFSGQQETSNSKSKTTEHEAQAKEATETARMQAAECLNSLGQFVAAALDPFGIDVDVSVEPKESDKAEKKSDDKQNENTTEDTASADKVDVPINVEAEKEKPMECDNEGQDEEWTVIREEKQKLYPDLQTEKAATLATSEASQQVQSATTTSSESAEMPSAPVPGTSAPVPGTSAGPAGQDQEMVDPKIQIALQAMTNMGFTNEGGWLTSLLEAKQGDIGKVLDMLQPVKK